MLPMASIPFEFRGARKLPLLDLESPDAKWIISITIPLVRMGIVFVQMILLASLVGTVICFFVIALLE